ncbi:hypothetical protein F5B20DRAFT_533533 [Whalleya microplaca]|nr:hypothetical protein F5B20DRAFT_533533 [Whalleya microplaca]
MDWVRRRWTMSEHDLESFEYASQKSKVLKLGYNDEDDRVTKCWDLKTEVEWLQWIQDNKDRQEGPESFITSVILAGRAPEDSTSIFNASGLSYLPFTRHVFECILSLFFIHESIARVISRNYAASFSHTYLPNDDLSSPAIVYTCRSTALWKDDMALSATYFPHSGRNYAIFYGCSEQQLHKSIMTRVNNRLIKSSEDAFIHPMLLVGIFVEIERSRMMNLIRNGKKALEDDIDVLQAEGYDALGKAKQPIDPWLDIYTIKNEAEHWTKLLSQMITHVDELEYQHDQNTGVNKANHGFEDGKVELPTTTQKTRETFIEAGHRIRDRLTEITLDYEGWTKECDMIINGMTLATNLVLARDNMRISNETVKISDLTMSDGKQMKSVALLTMVFLPATFVATLFSMTFFDLDYSYVWLYPVITIPLTIAVVGVWALTIMRPARRKETNRQMGDNRKGLCCWV